MKIVQMTSDMRPWRKGQDAVLPDKVAESLVASGEAKNPRPFPPPDTVPAVESTAPPAAKPKSRGGYMTRKRG